MAATPRRGLLAALAATLASLTLGGAVSPVGAQDGSDVTAAMELLQLDASVAAELVAGSLADATGDTFRYAVPGSRPATLDEGYVDIVRVGAAEVHWGADASRVTCGTDGDALVVCAGSGPDLGVPHALFWMEVDGELPKSPELSASLAFPVLTDGGAPWVAQGPFAWDTFQGTDRWHDLGIRPDTDWQIVVQRFTGEDVIVEPTNAFAVLLGRAFVMAVPVRELEPLAEGVGSHAAWTPGQNPPVVLAAATATEAPQPSAHPWRWGAAVHFHDGTFGSSPDDTSGVDSHPDTDTDQPRGPDQLADPTAGPVVAAPPPEATATPTASAPATEPAGSGEDGDGDDGGSVPWVPIGIAVVVIGGGLVLLGTRQRPAGAPACDCKVTVAIEGPTEMGRCCMGASSYATHDVEGVSPDGESAINDRSQVHVDGDDANGHDVIDALFRATLSATCTEGATARIADATYDWSVTGDDTGFDVSVQVHVPVHCPAAAEHPGVTVTATHRVAYHSAPCLIGVLIEQNGTFEISHVDVQIICGDYNEIFGYFPLGARSLANTIGGATGQVIRTSGAKPTLNEKRGLTTGIVDKIGADYGRSHAGKKLKVYWIEPEDCSVCADVRAWWERLAADPGTYYLLGENCSTKAWKSLTENGAFPPTLRPSDGPGTPGGMEARLRMDHEAGGGHVTDVSEIR